ncbi:Cu/Pi carrier, variant 2 [Fusarium falciforme]
MSARLTLLLHLPFSSITSPSIIFCPGDWPIAQLHPPSTTYSTRTHTRDRQRTATMSPLHPPRDAFQGSVYSPLSPTSRTPYQARPELYSAYSIVDTAKDKAKQLSAEATAEFEKASSKAKPNGGKIELYSGKYYAACTFGGLLACGLTHAAVTPLDLVKTRRQVDSKLYTGNFQAWGKIYRAEGIRGIFTGWSPTLFGYSAQGAFKYGWYEFFKKTYSDMAGPEAAHKYKTGLYLAASASAEFLADIALCPFEAVKVRMQGTIPNPYTGTFNGISSVTAKEGAAGLYKGLYPLWGRQIPYTMMKFASFETIVEMIYDRLPGQKKDYGKAAQTGVSFTAGYLAGILCAIVSHPADVMVSKLNANRAPGEAFGGALSRIYKDIGFSGLWNGLPVRIVMIGTLTGLQWMIYDYFKIFMGFPTTGGAPPPAKKTE